MGERQTAFERFSAFSFFLIRIKPHFEIAKKKKKKKKKKERKIARRRHLHDLTQSARASRAADQREYKVARPRTV